MLVRVAGIDTADIVDVTGAGLTGVSTSATPVSSASTETNTLFLGMVAVDRNRVDASDTVSGTGWTEIGTSGSSGGANGVGLIVAELDQSSIGNPADPVFGTWANDEYAALVLNVREAPAGGTPSYNIDLMDVYESSSTTLDSGTAICTDIDTDTAQSCGGNLLQGNTYRFELEVDNTGDAGTPTDFDYLDLVAASDVFGTITTGDVLDYGCGTNSDWTGLSIATGDVLTSVGSGTACTIASSGTVEYWVIITLDTDADDGSGTFFVDDGTVSDTSFTSTSFTVLTLHSPLTPTDTWSFVETTDEVKHYVRSGTDTFTFVESDNVVGHFVISVTDAWTFVESDNVIHGFVASGIDSWSFVETTDENYVQVRIVSDNWVFVESSDRIAHYTSTESDVWSFVETDDIVAHYTQSASDVWSFVENTDVVKKFIRTTSDIWSFVENTNETLNQVRSGSDVWSFVEQTDLVNHYVSSGTDTFSFVEQTDLVSHYVASGTDTFSFVEQTNIASSRNESDVWSFVEQIDVVKHSITSGTDTWTFVEQVASPASHTPITETDTFGFVEQTDVIKKFVSDSTDTFAFSEQVDTLSRFIRSGTDTFSFVEQTDVEQMLTRSGTDTFTFVEQVDVVEMSARSGTDTWTFVEQVDVVPPTPTYNPTGKYIWFNLSPPETDRLGGVYAYECPTGEFIYKINTDGTVSCRVP